MKCGKAATTARSSNTFDRVWKLSYNQLYIGCRGCHYFVHRTAPSLVPRCIVEGVIIPEMKG